MSELQIEEGKWYRRRDGAVVGPAESADGRTRPWCVDGWFYTTAGRIYDTGESTWDLVEEVPAPLPQNPVDIAIAAEIDAETAATTFGPLGQYAASDDTECTRDLLRNGIFVPDQKMANPRRAVDIAGKAASLVGGDRDRQHGAKHDNFRRIAGVWNAWLAIRKEPAAPLDAHDVGCMMALMKLARTQSGALNVDDYVDACGYAACAGEVAQINET